MDPQALTPTVNQVRERLGLELSKTAASAKQLQADVSNGSISPAEAAAREVNISRRQADAQQWIASYRARKRGNRKAAAAAAAQQQQQQQQEGERGGVDTQRLEQVQLAVWG